MNTEKSAKFDEFRESMKDTPAQTIFDVEWSCSADVAPPSGPNGERGDYCSPDGYTPVAASSGRTLDGVEWCQVPEEAR